MVRKSAAQQFRFKIEHLCVPYRYSCLFKRSEGANSSVSSLVCQCSSQAAKLTQMTQYPHLEDTNSLSSDWCRNTESLKAHSLSLVPVVSAAASTQEDNRVQLVQLADRVQRRSHRRRCCRAHRVHWRHSIRHTAAHDRVAGGSSAPIRLLQHQPSLLLQRRSHVICRRRMAHTRYLFRSWCFGESGRSGCAQRCNWAV